MHCIRKDGDINIYFNNVNFAPNIYPSYVEDYKEECKELNERYYKVGWNMFVMRELKLRKEKIKPERKEKT